MMAVGHDGGAVPRAPGPHPTGPGPLFPYSLRVVPKDRLGRPLRSLRVSVTDRCNLRCTYCMPERDYVWLPRQDVLSYEEIGAIVDAVIEVGVDKIRLTGGEPLARADLPVLVRLLAGKPGLRDLALTTNGVLLAEHARALRTAGLGRLTVSLDTLRPDRFLAITGRDAHRKVMEGIHTALAAGFAPLKLDTVVLRGQNDDELADLIAFGREIGAEVRFIEYMDVGGATRWSPGAVVSRAEILAAVARVHGLAEPASGNEEGSAGPARGSDPAERFLLPDGTVFGIIASTTAPFCRSCDRARLTADGVWYQCLYARSGLDLRAPLRAGATRSGMASLIADAWRARTDRGAEERLGAKDRGAIIPVEALRRDPHLEMHTRGG
jgi:cyclic pyranopterin phosphate synthase